MSALGHKRTFRSAITMSALPPKADIRQRICRRLSDQPIASSVAEISDIIPGSQSDITSTNWVGAMGLTGRATVFKSAYKLPTNLPKSFLYLSF
jgi:hypothetical protein